MYKWFSELKAPWNASKRNGPVTASSVVESSAVLDLGGDRRKLKLERNFYVYMWCCTKKKALFCFPIPSEYVEGVTGEKPFIARQSWIVLSYHILLQT